MEYIVRHALRTLIKQGHPKALQALGFSHAPEVRVSKLIVPKLVRMNSAIEFSFSIKSLEDTNVLIDYILYFQNKAGKLNSKKVFKLGKYALLKNKSIAVAKRHTLRRNMTTRTLYPGRHEVELQINGKRVAKRSFILK